MCLVEKLQMSKNKKLRGVILAGGKGTRLQPATRLLNKHLIPLINVPMISYPLSTLRTLGIEDILIVTGGDCLGGFADYLGDGSKFEVNLTYKVQRESGGIAQALGLARDFSSGEPIVVILGDNVFQDDGSLSINYSDANNRASLVVCETDSPERFGVYDPKRNEIIEKPTSPRSKLAVTGLYSYPADVFDFIDKLTPSERGELEITDVNNYYLSRDKANIFKFDGFWSDCGTPESMLATINHLHGKRKQE